MTEILIKGMTNKEVAILKYLIGFSEIKQATEIFDDDFDAAVRKFQSENNLAVDGKIGKQTKKAIALKAPTTSILRNRKSREACALQLFFNLTVDGIYGSKTKAAVKAYQAEKGLKADGVCGPKTWLMILTNEQEASIPSGDLNPGAIKPVDYKQGDKRWGKKMYSNHGDKSQTMASSACGPTSMADIVATWWDEKVTPYDLALKSMSWGTRTYNSGTSATFFRRCAELYKASKYSTTANIDNAIKCLNEGGYVIVCFGVGTKGKSSYKKWTAGGHYCCIWKWDGKYFYINDPASSKAARAKGTYDEVKDARKGFYCFWK